MNEEEIRSQINDIIEGEIQNSINEYLVEQPEEEKGFSNGDGKLNVSVSKDEVAKLVKEYKKALKYRKSNLFQASQLVDKNGGQL